MSKVSAGISKIAGIASVVLSVIPGGQPFAVAASAIAAASGTIAQVTAKPPLSVPGLSDYTVGPDQPFPYLMGRCQTFGHMIHREAHGRTRQDVPNPWLTETYILSGAGPVEAIQTRLANNNAVTFDEGGTGFENDYYDKYMRSDTQLGLDPEAAALDSFVDEGSPPGITQWTSARKLSSFAAVQYSMLLDDVETHYRNGPPKFSAVGQWVKGYDPRLDSTYAGGSGAHRLGTESTYEYHANPPLHAALYAYGRYKNGTLVCGGGLSVTAIDWPSFVDAANTADTNGWTIGGPVYEAGENGEIWNNLKQILRCAAAVPVNDKGLLRCIHQNARVTVDTITGDDIVGPCTVSGMTPWAKGYNTVIPKYTSEANDWAFVGSDPITVSALETAQGETRTRAEPYPLVTDKDQAAQLGTYAVYDSVEPIATLTLSRRFIAYDIGDAFTLDLVDELGLTGEGYIINHEIDVQTGNVTIGLKIDTSGKHAYALGRTGTAPDHPALVTNEDLDLAAGSGLTAAVKSLAIQTGRTSSCTITATDAGSDATISISAHSYIYGNPLQFPESAVDAGTVTGLAYSTKYYLSYDDEEIDGGAVTFLANTDYEDSLVSDTNPFRHYVGVILTPAASASDTDGRPLIPAPIIVEDPINGLPITRLELGDLDSDHTETRGLADGIIAGTQELVNVKLPEARLLIADLDTKDIAIAALAAESDALLVTVSPASASGGGTGTVTTSTGFTITVTGGTPPYVYATAHDSGDGPTGITIVDGTTPTPQFSASVASQDWAAYYTTTVTDDNGAGDDYPVTYPVNIFNNS